MSKLDDFMLKLGFHRHKEGYNGKGLYFQVGGYDLTKAQATGIMAAFTTELEKAKLDGGIIALTKVIEQAAHGPFDERKIDFSDIRNQIADLQAQKENL